MFKPIEKTASVTCISIEDPAIDLDASNMQEYAGIAIKQPGRWSEFIKTKPGEALTRFVVGVLPSDEANRIIDDCGLHRGELKASELAWRSFLATCRGVEGWPDEVPKGADGYVDKAWLKATFAKGLRRVACEIGMYAWQWNQLTEDEVKN